MATPFYSLVSCDTFLIECITFYAGYSTRINMRLPLALSIAAATLATIGAVLYLTAPPPNTSRVEAFQLAVLAGAAPRQLPTVQKAAQAKTAVLTEAMRARFETAPNYAAFIHDAMQRPLEGGRFYAFIAYNRCQEIVALEPKHFLQNAQSPRRDKAIGFIKDLMERCQGVRDHFPDAGVFFRRLIIANAKGIPDTLLNERGAFKPTTKTEAVNDIHRAVATGDPILIAATIEINSDHLAHLFMPGYKPNQHQRMVHLAAAAAACEITKSCEGHLWIQIMCATGEECRHTDLGDFLRDGLIGDEARAFDAIKLALLKYARP